MEFKQPEAGGDQAAELESLSDRWVADLRADPNFTPGDEYLLAHIIKSGRSVTLFASQQRLRQHHIELHGSDSDIIGDQLRVLRHVFGRR